MYNESEHKLSLNKSIEELININPIDYSWEYKRYRRQISGTDPYKDVWFIYLFQNIGVNNTNNVNISSLPRIIANAKIPLPTGETLSYVWATEPSPGPRLFKQAPIAEKEDSKSNPETTKPSNKIINEITYIEKKPHTEAATSFSTFLVPIFKDMTALGWIIFFKFI